MARATHWRDEMPDLAKYIDEQVEDRVDDYGRVYLEALQRAYEDYGVKGVSIQLLYIANNMKRGSAEQIKELTTWSKLLKQVACDDLARAEKGEL